MKVSDFEIDWSSGLYNCCFEDISERSDEDAYEGMIITCEYCKEEMILRQNNGKLMWCKND